MHLEHALQLFAWVRAEFATLLQKATAKQAAAAQAASKPSGVFGDSEFSKGLVDLVSTGQLSEDEATSMILQVRTGCAASTDTCTPARDQP